MSFSGASQNQAAQAIAKHRDDLLLRRIRRGLDDPNPGVARLEPAPTVMASPPTVTAGAANAATTITGGVDIAYTDARLRYLGAAPVLVTVGGVDYGRVETWASGSPSQAVWSVEFMHYGAKFDMILNAPNASKYRVWADGQYAALAAATGPGPTSSRFRYLVDFGSTAQRRIRLEFDHQIYFRGVAIGPTDSLWRVPTPRGKRVAIIGDSFVAGTGATDAMRGWVNAVSTALGWRDVRWAGQGGTGYLNPSTSSKRTFRTRLPDDAITPAAEIVLVMGGINDTAYNPGGGVVSAAQIATEAGLLYDAIRAGLTDAVLIVVAPFELVGSPTAAMIAANAAVVPVAAAAAHLVIDPLGSGWWSGTGKVGTTTGSGNADIFRASDGVHPTDAGHAYLGSQVAAAITAAMPLA